MYIISPINITTELPQHVDNHNKMPTCLKHPAVSNTADFTLDSNNRNDKSTLNQYPLNKIINPHLISHLLYKFDCCTATEIKPDSSVLHLVQPITCNTYKVQVSQKKSHTHNSELSLIIFDNLIVFPWTQFA